MIDDWNGTGTVENLLSISLRRNELISENLLENCSGEYYIGDLVTIPLLINVLQ